MTHDRVRKLDLHVAEVSPKTKWIFLEVEAQSGLIGWGEATLTGAEDAVLAAMAKLAPLALGLPEASPRHLPKAHPLTGVPEAAAFSALDQALWDIAAQRQGVGLAAALGGMRRERILLYANINRRTLDRSPEGFAASARQAVAAGYGAIKIAPFDEVSPAICRAGHGMRAAQAGLARIASVREAIGTDRDLMVDCHWRFDEAAATALIAALAPFGLHWLECPVPESTAELAGLRRLRSLANRQGMRLAGCEENIRREGFVPFLEAQAYDVMMPDVKYAGGLSEILALAELLARHGVAFSPHNPSGPVCHAASLHVAAAAENLSSLEIQFDETPWFEALQAPALAHPKDGFATLPAPAGLGMSLDRDALDRCRKVRWSAP
ncbi:galactonate dehydratase [Rhizobiales bacterium GAS191]|nr:galactonate dehydratase [Rhizobiales bacterium GAS191]